MVKKFAISAMTFMCLLSFPANAPARIITEWPYEKLFMQADLIVIAVVMATEVTDDKEPEHSWPYDMVGQNITFKIKHTLKGKAAGDKIEVLHFKFGKPKNGMSLSARNRIT